MPEVAHRLLRSFDKQNLAMGELAELLGQDQGLDHQMAVMQCNHAEVTAELARRWRIPQTLIDGLQAAGDPMAARPFSKLGAVLRIASVLADAGDQGLPPVATLVETQGELAAHLHLDLDWLGQHLLPYRQLCSGVDQMLH